MNTFVFTTNVNFFFFLQPKLFWISIDPVRGLHKKYLQVSDTCFPDSARDGFHRRAHRVQKRCQLACAFSFSALFKQKSRQSHNISVERSPVWHDCRFKDVLADLKKKERNLAVLFIICIHATHSIEETKIWRRKWYWIGVYGELNQWEVHSQRLRGVTDWLRGSFKTMLHCGNGGVNENPPHAWSLLCHHDYGLDPLTSWDYQYTSSSSFKANSGSSVNSFNRTCNISNQTFLSNLNGLKELLNIFQRYVNYVKSTMEVSLPCLYCRF